MAAAASSAATAATSAASSAAASVTRARQFIGQRKNQEQVASGMFRLAIAISISTILSLLVCSGVFYGLNNLHESGAYVFQSRNTFWGLVGASFVFTFFGTFVPMFRKVDFGPPAQRVAAQRASAQVAQELIQQVPQIQVAPQVDMSVLEEDEPEPEPEIKPKQEEEKPKVVERTADGPQHLKDASGWLLSCMTRILRSPSVQISTNT